MNTLLEQFDIEQSQIEKMLTDSIGKAEDGELFVEYCESEGLVFDNGKLKTGTFDTRQGFGLRAVSGELSAYSHSGDMSQAGLKRACDAVRSVQSGKGGTYASSPRGTNRKLYSEDNPILAPTFEDKVKLLEEIDAYARDADDKVRQVTVSLGANWQVVVPAPAGTFDIVLSAGWPGVMLHEAVGHGLEGDFNRKKTSAFSELMGQQVASKGVTKTVFWLAICKTAKMRASWALNPLAMAVVNPTHTNRCHA